MNEMTLVAARLFAYDNLFLETGESILTLPQERFVKAFLKLFEPQIQKRFRNKQRHQLLYIIQDLHNGTPGTSPAFKLNLI